MPNNTFALLGIEDSMAFYKTIDTVGNILDSVFFEFKEYANYNNIDFDNNKSKVILYTTAIIDSNKTDFYPKSIYYTLDGKLIKSKIWDSLPQSKISLKNKHFY